MRQCEFCGLPAVPGRYIVVHGQATNPCVGTRYAYVCETHKAALERDHGWRERERARLKEDERRLAAQLVKDQGGLF